MHPRGQTLHINCIACLHRKWSLVMWRNFSSFGHFVSGFHLHWMGAKLYGAYSRETYGRTSHQPRSTESQWCWFQQKQCLRVCIRDICWEKGAERDLLHTRGIPLHCEWFVMSDCQKKARICNKTTCFAFGNWQVFWSPVCRCCRRRSSSCVKKFEEKERNKFRACHDDVM